MPLRLLFALLILLTTLAGTRAGAQTPAGGAALRIGTWDRSSDPLTAVSEAVLQRAYEDVGRPPEWVELPNRRALQALLAGELDGNLHRVQDLQAAQPSLLRVPTAINVSALRLYVGARSRLQIDRWEQLKGLRVSYPRGVLRIEQLLPAGVKRVEAGSVHEQFRQLGAGMADVALCTEPLGSPAPRAGMGLRRLDTVLEEHQLFHYLSGKHVELARQLGEALERLQRSGELEAIRQAALKRHWQEQASH